MPATKKAPQQVYEITSRSELDVALEILARVKAQELRVQADLEAELAKLKARYQEKLFFEYAGERLPCSTVRTVLERAAIAFATEHRDQVFTGTLKTERFSHGEICARKVPAAVDYAEGETRSSVLKRLQEKTGVCKKLLRWLKELPLWRQRTASQFLKCSVDLVSCTEIKKQLDAGELDAKDLEQAGYVVTEEREAISVKAYEHVVRAEG